MLPGGTSLSKDRHYIDATKVWCPAPTTGGTKQHLNSTLPPDDPAAQTEFSYLTTDGSDDAPYLYSGSEVEDGVYFGGDQLTYGGDPVTYGA